MGLINEIYLLNCEKKWGTKLNGCALNLKSYGKFLDLLRNINCGTSSSICNLIIMVIKNPINSSEMGIK